MWLEIEKVDVFRKVLNKQFFEKLRAIFIVNKTQLHTPTDCFSPWREHQGDLIQMKQQSVGVCNCVITTYIFRAKKNILKYSG